LAKFSIGQDFLGADDLLSANSFDSFFFLYFLNSPSKNAVLELSIFFGFFIFWLLIFFN
tara:strand:- start:1004 stop:1180 length:177 start_codon:yes stop_codon:yes gene_type:complete